MKWTIQELRKLSRTIHQFQGICDCKQFLSEDDPDILDISEVSVEGDYRILETEKIYLFNCEVSCVLTMPCAITLQEVEVLLRFQTSLEFSQTIVDDNTHLIDGITIDLDPVIYSEILVEKPMRVVHPNASEDYNSEQVHLEEEEINSSNPFATLKNKNY